MAGYREHISVSGMCGACYGAAAVLLMGFTPEQAGLAAMLTWLAGMLPDLDSDSGKPIQEVFSLAAAAVPLVMMRRLFRWAGSTEGALLAAALIYAAVRYGAAALLKRVSVHRGMFHSLPAMLIAAEAAFLAFGTDEWRVRLLLAGGVAIGFLSHLVLDELYSVQWDGVRVKLAKSAGSALKWVSNDFTANTFTFALLMLLTYIILVDIGLIEPPEAPARNRPGRYAAEELPERF